MVCFFGDGAANEGAFHEAVNLAAVWNLPVVFVCENNGYGMSMSTEQSIAVEQHRRARARRTASRASSVDGNDVAAVYEAVSAAVERARAGEGPTLIECMTYRWKGHSKSDKNLYRTREEIAEWRDKDPIAAVRGRGPRAPDRSRDDELEAVARSRPWTPIRERRPRPARRRPPTLADDLLPTRCSTPRPRAGPSRTTTEPRAAGTPPARRDRPTPRRSGRRIGQAMEADDAGLPARRGHRGLRRRVRRHRRPADHASAPSGSATRRSPSSAIVGAAVGAAMAGMRPIVEIQFSDFIDLAMDQIVNQAAKIHFMLGGEATRADGAARPAGSGTGAAAQHSQSLEAWFAHVPGLKVVMPATAGRRQGPAAGRDRRPQPGDRPRAQAALPHEGPGARARPSACRSARPRCAAGART